MVGASGRTLSFADGGELDADAVIWATGLPARPFVDRASGARSPRGGSATAGGSPTSPGLYFLGLSWQHTRGSALLGWVKDDAKFIAARIDALARSRAAGEPSPENEGTTQEA